MKKQSGLQRILVLSISVFALSIAFANSSALAYETTYDSSVQIENSADTVVSHVDLQNMMEAIPELYAIPQFSAMLDLNADVILTPQDLWTIFTHIGPPEVVQDRLTLYQGQIVSIKYLGDCNFNVSAQGPVVRSLTRGGETITSTTKTYEDANMSSKRGIRVSVTAYCREVWAGGGQSLFEYLRYDLTEQIFYPFAGQGGKGAILEMQSDSSYGLNATAHFNLWLRLDGQLALPKFQFSWG